jgi:pyruvate dehydrogenase E2 component (dihydrolipoamide acetyltransferase)
MPTNVYLPQWGMLMTEATIIKWLKKEGAEVSKGEPLVEVESSKVKAEIESPADGILGKIKTQEGDVVKVGAIVALVTQEGEVLEDDPKPKVENNEQRAKTSENISSGKISTSTSTFQVTPVARKLAKDLGLDLSLISGTGPRGRIIEKDVRNYSNPQEKAEKNVISGIRKVIARRMSESNEIPSVTISSKVDLTASNAFQTSLLPSWRKEKMRPTFQDIIVKAVAIALKEHKIINSHFVNDEIITFEEINLGIAYATDAGLVVPVIKNADNKSIIDIAKIIRQFSKTEKTGFSAEDFNGGTFSITSLNSTVIDTFNPLLNPPQVGILGIGRTSEEVFFDSGEFKERKICSLNFTFDHRVIDGYPAARFVEFLVKVLNDPESIG